MAGLAVSIKRLRPGPVPDYMTDHAAGVDLHAALDQSFTLHPGERALVPTGIALEGLAELLLRRARRNYCGSTCCVDN